MKQLQQIDFKEKEAVRGQVARWIKGEINTEQLAERIRRIAEANRPVERAGNRLDDEQADTAYSEYQKQRGGLLGAFMRFVSGLAYALAHSL